MYQTLICAQIFALVDHYIHSSCYRVLAGSLGRNFTVPKLNLYSGELYRLCNVPFPFNDVQSQLILNENSRESRPDSYSQSWWCHNCDLLLYYLNRICHGHRLHFEQRGHDHNGHSHFVPSTLHALLAFRRIPRTSSRHRHETTSRG